MAWIRGAVFEIWLYASMGVLGLVFAPIAAASRKGAIWAMRVYCIQALWMLRAICGVDVQVRGQVPEGGALVAAKHQSFLEIMALMRLLPNPRFVMKRSLIWAPIFGLYALRIGSLAIDRSRGARAIRRLDALTEDAEANAQIVIFPQGTRLAPDIRAPYLSGVARLYGRRRAPCVPVALNTGVFWGRRGRPRGPGVAVIAFLEPTPPGLSRGVFMSDLSRRIEAATDQLVSEARHGRADAASQPIRE